MNDSLHTSTVPSWAAFFTREQYGVFVTLVEAGLRQLGLEVTMGDGVAYARERGGDGSQFGLQNLAQVCRHHPESGWPAVIERHFTGMLQARREDDDERPFEELRPLLKVRLYHDEFPDGAELVSRPVAPGVVAVLTLDLPTTIQTVSPRHLEGWGQTADALLDWGIANALADEGLEQVELEDGEGTTIQMLAGESFYVTTQLLGLGDWLPDGLPAGALVSVPQRHRLLFYPIEDLGVIPAISTMLRSTRTLYRQGPGSLSPELFWWRDGQLTLLPSRQDDDGSLAFSPTDEFLACLDRMANPS